MTTRTNTPPINSVTSRRPPAFAKLCILWASCGPLACSDASDSPGSTDVVASTGEHFGDTTSSSSASRPDSTGVLSTSHGSAAESSDSSGGETTCGNGTVDDDEACDDGDLNGSYGACAEDCSGLGAHCGDAQLQAPHESCDSALSNARGHCNDLCQVRGSVLEVLSEIEAVQGPEDARGIEVAGTRDGNITVVFGGSEVSVWEIDSETLMTSRLRSVDLDMHTLTGAALVGDEELVLTQNSSRVLLLDETLDAALVEVTPPHEHSYNSNLGVVAYRTGFMTASFHSNGSGTGYWVQGHTSDGDATWELSPNVPYDSEHYGRAFETLEGSYGMLLTDTQLNVFAPSGANLWSYELDEPETLRDLCTGEDYAFAYGSPNAEGVVRMRGFDERANPTSSVAYSIQGWGFIGCGVKRDGSPIVAEADPIDTGLARLHITGFDGTSPDWNLEEPVPARGWSNPAVYLEEDLGRAWVFYGGAHDSGMRYLGAYIIAI